MSIPVERAGRALVDRAGLSIFALCCLALFIEIAQEWPELAPGAHALGEVVRNLAYALIGALLFHWIVVQLPQARRERAAYEGHRAALQFLATIGGLLIANYRLMLSAHDASAQINAWDRKSIFDAAHAIAKHDTQKMYNGSHFELMGMAVTGVQTSLDGMAPSMSFFNLEVAHALGLYPALKGLNQLQVPAPGEGVMSDAGLAQLAHRSAHIVWELLEASRRLVGAFDATAPDFDLDLQGVVTGSLSDGTPLEEHLRVTDLHVAD